MLAAIGITITLTQLPVVLGARDGIASITGSMHAGTGAIGISSLAVLLALKHTPTVRLDLVPPKPMTSWRELGPQRFAKCRLVSARLALMSAAAALGLAFASIRACSISGATMVASDSITNMGVRSVSLSQVIFSLGEAPEYEP
jgi:hypothetical protein